MNLREWLQRAGVICLLVACLATTSTAQGQQLKELNFGVIPAEAAQNVRKDWQPFVDDMSKALGVKVNAFFASDYAAVIEGMRFNKVQIAWFGNKSAMEAVDRANGEVFARTSGFEGNSGYYSLIITNTSNGVDTLDEALKNGKKYVFGNGDPNSTSGFLVPGYYVFTVNKIDPKTHFKAVRNANHEANLLAVVSKQVDLATNNDLELRKFQRLYPDKAAQIKVLWKSPMIANDPLVWRKDLPEDLRAKIKAFIMGYGRQGPDSQRQLQVLSHLGEGWRPFVESSNAQLIPIRQLSLAKDRMTIENSQSMSPQEKRAKLAEIDLKLADLQKQAQNLP